MEQVKSPDFERRPPGEGIFWNQDAKADMTLEVISPGCMVTARYEGVAVTIKVDAIAGNDDITGVVDGFDTRGGKHPAGLAVGERVQLAADQVFSCGCSAVS